MKIVKVFDYPYGDIVEVNAMAVYKGKLYAAVGPRGEFWVFDGRDWTLALDLNDLFPTARVPEAGETVGTFWGVCSHYNRSLYWCGARFDTNKGCIVKFDGRDWSIDWTAATGELYAIAPYPDPKVSACKLYTSGRDYKLYEFDGASWTELLTLATKITSAITDFYALWVATGTLQMESEGGDSPGKLYRVDPATASVVETRTLAEEDSVGGMAKYELRYGDDSLKAWLIAAGHAGTLYLRDLDVMWKFFQLPTREFVMRMFMARKHLWVLAGRRVRGGDRISRGGMGSIWRYDGYRMERLWELPAAPTCMAIYRGNIYVGLSWAGQNLDQPSAGAAQAVILEIPPEDLPAKGETVPTTITLWRDKAISGAEVLKEGYIACGGYSQITILLHDTEAATLDIQVDPDGYGTWRDYDPGIALSAGVLYTRTITDSFAKLRLEVTQGASGGTLNGWVNLL